MFQSAAVRRAVLLMGVVGVVLGMIVQTSSAPAIATQTAATAGRAGMSASELAMVDAVNAARASGRTCGDLGFFRAVPPLRTNALLAAAAQRHADDMMKNAFLEFICRALGELG